MRRMSFIATVFVILVFSTSAFGASDTPTLVYVPDLEPLVLAPGEAKPVAMTVKLENGESAGSVSVTFLGTVESGPLTVETGPKAPFIGMLGSFIPSTTTKLIVRAPEDVTPGDYQVVITSSPTSLSGANVDPGTGFVIEVNVSEQAESKPQCAAPPTVRITQSEPEVVWTPNKQMVEVTVTGTVDPGENCTLNNVGYTVTDDYGEFNAKKTATVEPDGRLLAPDNLTMDADGNVTLKVTVEASRRGDDPDGRNYGIRLTAANEKGKGESQLVTVTVSHDQGRKEAKR